MDTSFVRDLVVVTIESYNGRFRERKVVIRDKIKDFVSEYVATFGEHVTIYYNKAYIGYEGAIEVGEYLGTIDIKSFLN